MFSYFVWFMLLIAESSTRPETMWKDNRLPLDSIVYYDENGKPVDKQAYDAKMLTGLYSNYLSWQSGQPNVAMHMTRREPPARDWVEKKLSAFTFTDLDGRTWRSKSMKGKVTVLHFWSVGCGPCLREIPFLNSLKAANPGINWFALSFDDEDRTRRILQKYPVEFPVVPGQRDLATSLNIRYVPVTLILDERGILREVLNGPREDSLTLQSKIDLYQTR
jgi:thiol-disulfide isomerase/thioredoxin